MKLLKIEFARELKISQLKNFGFICIQIRI